MHTVMIVEDEPIIRDAVAQELSKWNYQVECVTDFNQVMDDFVKVNPQLVILDITLPFFNGYYWCQEIRKISNVPILFLSSHQQPMDIVMSINMGADDYITKPFEMPILVAKIQGLFRRAYEFVGTQDWIEYKGATLHLKTTQFTYKQQVIDLTKNEFQILRVLFERVGSFVSRDELMKEFDQQFPGYDFAANAGYGTAKHLEGLKKIGVTPIHRTSFEPVKSLVLGEKES